MTPVSLQLSEASGEVPCPREIARSRQPLVSLAMDWYNHEVHAGVVRAARDLGWNLDDEHCRGASGRFFPEDWVPDGVLTTTGTDAARAWVKDATIPVVRLLEDRAPAAAGLPADDVPTVVPDLREAGRIAAGHLLSLGITHLAYYRFHQPGNGNAVYPEFMKTCRKAGQEVVVMDFAGDHAGLPAPSRPARMEWLRRKIAELPLPCGIMADDDRLAIEVIMEATTMGRRVPEDIVVMGAMDLKLVHQRERISLSSVDVNLEQVGYEAGVLLDRMMRGERVEKKVMVPAGGLVERKSTSAFFCDDPRIAKTMVRIRRDYAEPLTLPLLAREAGMSVRALQRAYSSFGGNTIRDAIMERRLDAAVALLKDSDLKLESVAWESGLGSATNLCRLFKKRFGTTPGGWRRGGN